jgi:3-oxoacyl-[acyl-carrier protein] reductase
MITLIKILLIIFIPIFVFAENNQSAKTILVTSSTGALGGAIAENLAAKGYNLVLLGRDESKLNALKDLLMKKVKVEVIKFDYSDVATIEIAANSLKNQSIDAVVLIPPRPAFNNEAIPKPEQWRINFEEVFIGPLELIRLIPSKMKSPASIVIISGETSKYYMPSYPNTNVLRSMWSGEIKNLCHQLSENKIRVNAVSPGIILTKHHIKKIDARAKISNKSFEDQLSFETKDLPSKQYGTPEDVASIVHYLIDNNSKHINCENIMLNGGASKNY